MNCGTIKIITLMLFVRLNFKEVFHMDENKELTRGERLRKDLAY